MEANTDTLERCIYCGARVEPLSEVVVEWELGVHIICMGCAEEI
jgi:hypothetical protein